MCLGLWQVVLSIKCLTWAMPSCLRLWKDGSELKELPHEMRISPSVKRTVAAQTVFQHNKKSQQQNLPLTFPADTWHTFTKKSVCEAHAW